MKNWTIAALVWLLLAAPAAAADTDFATSIASRVTASQPYLATDYLPFIRSGSTYKIIGSLLVTTTDTQTLSNKTISGASNTLAVRIGSDVTGLGTSVGAWLATPSSANLATAVTDETGSGSLVFGISPTLVTPALGTPSAINLSNATSLAVTALSLTPTTNAISGNVSLNNTGSFFDGPVIAQGATGTWCAIAVATVTDLAGIANFNIKLHDGTTTIASTRASTPGAGFYMPVTLAGCIASPAGNLRISVKDETSTSGLIAASASGLAKDSSITAIRIQ